MKLVENFNFLFLLAYSSSILIKNQKKIISIKFLMNTKKTLINFILISK